MNVEQYLFQSPSPQRVQVGRPDTSVQKEENSSQTSEKPAQERVEIPQEVQNIQTENPQNIALKGLDTNQILDLYV